ncbi:MAG: ribosome small subunit-dependent GTPase A [Ignavibacteriales bacterium]|nr:ribosome small subunit-dependent GTPase A [Ignavibacteriales bacterium]
MKLELFGWNDFFETRFAQYSSQGLLPGRVTIQHKDRYILFTEQGEVSGKVSGKFRFEVSGLQDFPAVGDWVVFEIDSGDQSAVIHHVLERRNKFSRKVSGDRPDEQVIAANIDIAFLVMGLDGDYNIRRMERYLTVAWESGVRPIIVLNKSDVCPVLEECTQEVLSIAHGIDIIVMTARQSEQLAPLRSLLTPGTTGVLLGSSGVGKSTITNALLGKEYLKVNEVRENDSRGRHTTPHRELLILSNGGIIIDTPGLRELQLWRGDEGMQESFDDIEELALNCRFRDCRHEAEPHCAVKKAMEDGVLDSGRFENYLKLQREIQYLALKQEMGAQRLEKERWKNISKLAKKLSSKPR